MIKNTPEQNKSLVLEAFDTLFNKRDYDIVHGRFSGTGRPAAWVAADVVRIENGVLAKGVETDAQLDFLATESCDEVQGYLIGRPHPIAEYSKLIGRLEAMDEELRRA